MLQASPLVSAGLAVLALAVSAVLSSAFARVSNGWPPRAGAMIGAWLCLTAVLALSGQLERWDATPPPIMPALLFALIATLVAAFSRAGLRIAIGTPLWMLVVFQSFRLPLELVMHEAAREGVMPVQMSFSGLNFDIVTGSTALVLGLWLRSRELPRAVVFAWNALGSALLVNIMVIGLTSTPLVGAFGPDRLNTWVAYFPAAWLPLLLVPAALFGHVLVWRRLFSRAPVSPGVAPASEGSVTR